MYISRIVNGIADNTGVFGLLYRNMFENPHLLGAGLRELCSQEYLRDGQVADESDCLLQLTGGRERDAGEVGDVAVSEEVGRECL